MTVPPYLARNSHELLLPEESIKRIANSERKCLESANLQFAMRSQSDIVGEIAKNRGNVLIQVNLSGRPR